MNSETSSTKPSAPIPNWLLSLFVAVSAIGFLDSAYLAAKYFLGSPITCTLLKGCEKVTSSAYSHLFNLPISLFGVVYYLTLFFLSVYASGLKEEGKKLHLADFIRHFTVFGFVASLYFIFLQALILKALCLYCLVSAATSTTLFILGLSMVKYIRSNPIITND